MTSFFEFWRKISAVILWFNRVLYCLYSKQKMKQGTTHNITNDPELGYRAQRLRTLWNMLCTPVPVFALFILWILHLQTFYNWRVICKKGVCSVRWTPLLEITFKLQCCKKYRTYYGGMGDCTNMCPISRPLPVYVEFVGFIFISNLICTNHTSKSCNSYSPPLLENWEAKRIFTEVEHK